MAEIRNFNWVINRGYFDNLVYKPSQSPDKDLFLLDTGVIIDLEQEYFTRGFKNDPKKRKHPAALIERIAMNYPLIITPRVLREVKIHSEKCIVNGNRPEISEPTTRLVEALYDSESREVLELNRVSSLEYDSLAYNVYQASQEAFKGDYRKGEKDEISCTDRELITLALLLSHGRHGLSKINYVNILSPDEHIPRTVHVLKTLEEFKGCKVRAIPTRHNLRSYMYK